ncbi:hypothetical protein [Erwinia mallotivora]|uniref:Pentapeptide repeat-containing protein n=1 Tax=Erwinia mallotivora TaxID=69222 RepID=A0A014N8R8_9GAMM|nr:hypothetical protein [Erwinia mallotivora]EXU75753.1 hypothetical protein BG55_11345 [Erwinia mallotivora]
MKISEVSTENTAVSTKTDSPPNIVPHSDIKSYPSTSVTQQTHSVENNPEEFKFARYYSEVHETVQQFLKEKDPDVVNRYREENSYIPALKHFIDIYRSQTLDPKQVISLLGLCHELRNYIINCEKNNIGQGKLSINTMSAIKSCEELSDLFSKISGFDTYKIIKNPINNNSYSRLNSRQVEKLLKLLKCEPDERTLTMLVDAGILMKDALMNHFESIEESVIKNKIVNFLIYEGYEYNEVENFIKSIFSKMKSDEFVHDWINYGFPKGKGFINCINFFGPYINLKYAIMQRIDLTDYNFNGCDLTGSSLDFSLIFNFNPDSTILKDVTMEGINMASVCPNEREYLIINEKLKKSGVRILPYYESHSQDYSQEYSERFDSQ